MPVALSTVFDLAEHLVAQERSRGTRVEDYLSIPKSMSPDGAAQLLNYFFITPDYFTLLRVSPTGNRSTSALIHFAGGGARDLRPEGGLCDHLLLDSRKYEWGAPFVSHGPNGTVAVGTKYLFPSELIGPDNIPETANFILQMISVVGQTARALAEHLIPQHGGRLFQGIEDDKAEFFTLVMMS